MTERVTGELTGVGPIDCYSTLKDLTILNKRNLWINGWVLWLICTAIPFSAAEVLSIACTAYFKTCTILHTSTFSSGSSTELCSEVIWSTVQGNSVHHSPQCSDLRYSADCTRLCSAIIWSSVQCSRWTVIWDMYHCTCACVSLYSAVQYNNIYRVQYNTVQCGAVGGQWLEEQSPATMECPH